jgi:hypothetical protein
MRAQLHLDDPILVQYGRFVGNAIGGDLGTSIRSRRPVTVEIAENVGSTAQLAFAAVLVAVLYVHAVVPILPLLPARRDPIARSAGWDALASRVDDARRALKVRSWAGADRYADVSELAYHLPDRPEAFCICLAGRHNQYDLWPGFASRASKGDALVLALDERTGDTVHETAQRLAPYFDRVTRGALAPLLRRGDTVTVRRVWVLEGYRGGWPLRVEP